MNAMRVSELDGPPVTYEEYLRWPETNEPCELVDGRVVVSPSPGLRHQRAVVQLAVLLDAVVPADHAVVVSPVDWVLRKHPLLVRQPDLAVIRAELLPNPRLLTPPLLAVEVLSPTSRERDLITKRVQYAEAGLDWYWLVDIEAAEVLVLRRKRRLFVAHASARGEELLTVDEPFPVQLRPSDLA